MTQGSGELHRVAVFDVGETLVDETRSWSEAADAVGATTLTLFGALGALIERRADHRQVWELLGVDRPELIAQIRPEDLYPDAAPCLEALADAGLRIGLAGNQPEAAEEALAQLGLPVSFIASSSRWGVEKPSSAFFAHVVQDAAVPPEQIAYIGDRLDNDVLPARSAGMFAVFVRRGPWGHVHAHWPEAALASGKIDTLQELPAVLADWRDRALPQRIADGEDPLSRRHA